MISVPTSSKTTLLPLPPNVTMEQHLSVERTLLLVNNQKVSLLTLLRLRPRVSLEGCRDYLFKDKDTILLGINQVEMPLRSQDPHLLPKKEFNLSEGSRSLLGRQPVEDKESLIRKGIFATVSLVVIRLRFVAERNDKI
jgi:hypothetical protein